ncbi:MAG TPA: sugar nucleotide-binding protein, partial [Pedococcus sp.]|nr:sugar nucleotide-binding protein [Pedococcus sp.]
MKWLITGAGGMLGLDLRVTLALAGVDDRDVTPLTKADLDITNAEQVREAVRGHDVVVNCAAYTAVDQSETH